MVYFLFGIIYGIIIYQFAFTGKTSQKESESQLPIGRPNIPMPKCKHPKPETWRERL